MSYPVNYYLYIIISTLYYENMFTFYNSVINFLIFQIKSVIIVHKINFTGSIFFLAYGKLAAIRMFVGPKHVLIKNQFFLIVM